MTCRILICDENAFFRQSLHDILVSRFPEVEIGDAAETKDCLLRVHDYSPHIFFIDLFQAGEEGFELVRRVRERYPGTIIIAFTEYDLDEYRVAALLAGGNHVIPKDLWTGREILDLVETILINNEFFATHITKKQIVTNDSWERPLERRRKKLSKKDQLLEREYLAHNPERRREDL